MTQEQEPRQQVPESQPQAKQETAPSPQAAMPEAPENKTLTLSMGNLGLKVQGVSNPKPSAPAPANVAQTREAPQPKKK
jgi:hypothetical protein